MVLTITPYGVIIKLSYYYTKGFPMKINDFNYEMKDGIACISGKKNKDKYRAYQIEYREKHGVFPELDKKNNPFAAITDETYKFYVSLKRRGFYGAWFYHDYHGIFNRKLKELYHTFKKEWAFVENTNLTHNSNIQAILNVEPGEEIINDLGYRKDELGNYYEGTWKDGKLVYGFTYSAFNNTFYIGNWGEEIIDDLDSYDEEELKQIRLIERNKDFQEAMSEVNTFRFKGIRISIVPDKRKGDTIISSFGTFAMNESTKDIVLYDSIGMTITEEEVLKDNVYRVTVNISEYEKGYENGKTYEKILTEDSRNNTCDIGMRFAVYKDGEVARTVRGIDKFLHFILGWYMIIWYAYKFTYFLPFWLIYRASQKRNWR